MNDAFAVTNTGGVTIAGVTVVDAFDAGGSGALSAVECALLASPDGACSGIETTLLPGRTATFTATYTAVPADVNVGGLRDTATATGTPSSARVARSSAR